MIGSKNELEDTMSWRPPSFLLRHFFEYTIWLNSAGFSEPLDISQLSNSGILIKGAESDSTYDYGKIPENIEKKYFAINDVCKKFEVPISAAALQFCNYNKLISTMILGMDKPNQIQENISLLNYKIDLNFWKELKEKKLIDPLSPVPEW